VRKRELVERCFVTARALSGMEGLRLRGVFLVFWLCVVVLDFDVFQDIWEEELMVLDWFPGFVDKLG